MLIKSLLTTENQFNSTEDIFSWIKERNRDVQVKVKRVPFSELDGWHKDSDGSLHHNSGKFFSIQGIKVETDYGNINSWTQPIINQPEVGYLGIIAKEFNGVLYFLMQAKIEPGNVNCVQISPTLQATKSNYNRVHEGKSPNYLEYFVNAKPENIILDQLQSEQGARFLRKRNRNIIIKVNEDIKVKNDFRWMTLAQIKCLCQYDNIVNMDTRTVLSGLKFSDYITPIDDFNNISEIGASMLQSSSSNHSLNSMRDILSWLTSLKAKYDLMVSNYPLNKIKDWKISDNAIEHVEKKFFKVIGVNVSITNREVAAWCQPIIEPMQQGVCGFIVKRINGIVHFLVQAKLECGNFDVMEMAPTVQCLTGKYTKDIDSLPFLDYILAAPKERIIFDTLQSEEGGRFYKEQNRNIMVLADDNFAIEVPEHYIWMTLNQIHQFLRFNNFLNIQARSLISIIKYTK
jgi:oxidase EvaA